MFRLFWKASLSYTFYRQWRLERVNDHVAEHVNEALLISELALLARER